MKALTVKQPYAGAIFACGKNVENRTWKTHYRGRLLIHAGSGFMHDDPVLVRKCEDGAGEGAWSSSSIIGVVELVDCVRDFRSVWAQGGCWNWLLKNPRLFARPIPAKGQIGLWSVERFRCPI